MVSIHAAVTGTSESKIVEEVQGIDTGNYKSRVSEAVVEHLRPLRERINYYMENKDHLEKVIGAGNETAITIAQGTMNEAKKAVGFS